MHKILFNLYILSFFCLSFVNAQTNSYQIFNNIIIDRETSVVTCFVQDKQGMIWIGTDKGLFSYDGYSAQSHRLDDKSKDTWIYCMEIVNDRYIYIGTDDGINVYDIHKDNYLSFNIKPVSDIRSFLVDKGKLWIGTLKGLYTYDIHSKKLSLIDIRKNKGLPHSTIYSIISTVNGDIYVGTYNGLCRFEKKNGSFHRIALPGYSDDRNQFINSLQEDTKRGCIWIGTEGRLLKYDLKADKIYQIDDIHTNTIKSLALDKTGTLLIGTDNGLFTYNDNGTSHILHDSRNIQSLSNNVIWDIFKDGRDNVWLGTNSGISLIHSDNYFKNIHVSQVSGTGDGNQFYSILKDSQNFYWFGGGNGIMRFNMNNGVASNLIWYRIDNKGYTLPHNRIRHVYEDKDKNLWIATDGSINRYDYNRKQFVTYHITDKDKVNNSNWAYYIYDDGQGKIWVATCLGGIFVIDKSKFNNPSSTNITADYNISTKDGLSGMFINQIIPDKDGNIWALLYNSGIDYIDRKKYKATHINTDKYTNGSKPNFLMYGNDGNIWAAFRGGILRINPKDKSIKKIELNKFGNDEVLYMQDVKRNIWMSTSNGLIIIDKFTLNISHVNITSKNFTSIYYDKAADKVILGYADGFSITDSDIMNSKQSEQPIVITALNVNGELFNDGDSSLRYTDDIELSHDQNNFSVDISDFTYPFEKTDKFVYRLDDVDSKWNLLPQNSNRISYNNLDPGSYTLCIARLNENGEPSQYVKEIHITIVPPIYLTTWAKLLYAMLALGLIVWTINFFMMRNRLHVERMEKEKILQQSREKIEFYTNLSHDLKTPLSLIIAPVSKRIADASNQQEKKILDSVLRNAMKLNSLIHQVLDFNKIDNNSNALLILSHTEFVGFVEKVYSSYSDSTKEKSIKTSFHTNIKSLYIDIDIIKWESILNNILSNAVKYTPEDREIDFSLLYSKEDNLLTLTLKDTGVGIPSQDLPYIFQRFFQSSSTKGKKEGTGIGLYLVKKYTELHGATVDIASQENCGTTVTIKLPVNSDSVVIDKSEHEKVNDVTRKRPLILVVDDNPEMTTLIEELVSAKYDCAKASSGSDGIKMSLSLIPDLIVTDLMMPGMNGLEMCAAIRRNVPTSTIPMILLTAKADKNTELESIRSNIDAFIAKPFQYDILLSRIEQLLLSKHVQQTKSRIEVISQPKEIEAVSIDEKFLMDMTQIIEDHISDSEFNVNALSEISSIGSKQVYRKIKQLTGQTPVEYIKSIRMKKAVMLLEQKKFSISEVMYMVGFSSSSYFSKCFQGEFGMTPKQYMEKE